MDKVSSFKYNKKRKELLLKKDNNINVPNIDLGFYDLTTYYSNEEDSIISKILIYENEKRRIQHITNKKIFFMPEQEETIKCINEHDRIIISAPTSFGKTLILKEYIYRNKDRLKNIVYIVPTNALAYELEKDFKNNNSFNTSYLIFDKNKSNVNKNDQERLLFIGTQEKFMEINDSFDSIDLFVIDEAYKLSESIKKQRGFKLSEVFVNSIDKKTTKIVLLTPNAELVGFDKFGFYEYQTYFNAVDKQFHSINVNEFNDILINKAKKDKTILYCGTPNDMVKIAEDIKKINKVESEFISFLEKEFHPDWSVIKLLKKGILTHHGLMPKYIQNHMMDLFVNNNDYNLLIGTNSISEGINTPTKNLFFYKDINVNSTKNKGSLLYKNTIGRAGRLGKYPIGHVYSINSDLENLDKEIIRIELAVSKKENLEEIEDSKNDDKINDVLSFYKIDNSECIKNIKTFHLSITKLKKIFDVLKNDLSYAGIKNIPYMAYSVFSEDYNYYTSKNDDIYIRGCLQYSYQINGHLSRSLISFTDKIDYFKYQYSKRNKNNASLDNSTIIEGYMKFMYNTLEYYILPIMTIGKTISEYQGDWIFGKNVKETIKYFFNGYYNIFYGINIDKLSDNQKKIMMTLKEYGIAIKEVKINSEILDELESELNVRFSTYDVIKAINKLSKGNSKNKNIYLYILNKYIN